MSTWDLILRIGGATFLLLMLIFGIKDFKKELVFIPLRNKVFVILSLLALPLMFGTCTAINKLSPDKAHDVFGFTRSVVEEKSGFETRSMRRERGMKDIQEYFSTKHGLYSMLSAVIVGAVFFSFIYFFLVKKGEYEDIKIGDGYYIITFVLGILSLVVFSNS